MDAGFIPTTPEKVFVPNLYRGLANIYYLIEHLCTFLSDYTLNETVPGYLDHSSSSENLPQNINIHSYFLSSSLSPKLHM